MFYNIAMLKDFNQLLKEPELIKIRRFIKEKELLEMGDRVLVALSGGADSVVLLVSLLCLRDEYSLEVEAFHLNHNIRDEAKRDENFCRQLCNDFGVRLHVYSRDIPKEVKESKISEELAGRHARYEIMDELMAGFTKAATAHHCDDNAETLLMHIIRGSGVKGLCGIAARRDDTLIRPLLCLTKDEIFSFVEKVGCGYVTDKTNFENDYFRNRVRNVLLPEMKKENPNISIALMELSHAAEQYCSLAEDLANEIEITSRNGSLYLRYEDIYNCREIIKYTLILKLCGLCGVESDVSRESIKDLIELISHRERTSWSYDLHKVVFSRFYDTFRVSLAREEIQCEDFCYPLGKKTGVFIFPKQGFILRLSVAENFKKNGSNKHTTYIDYDKITDNISIRSRKDGDKFRQIGLDGQKSVKKLFIDRKIPRTLRGKIPLLINNDEIVAVIGFETAENFKVDETTQKILSIELLYMEEENA